MDLHPLNERQLDALREICNVGMGHAATALSQLTGKTIHLNVPQVRVGDAATLAELVGAAEEPVIGIHLRMIGTAQGNMLMVFPRESAARILDKLLPQRPSGKESLTQLERSALKEVGNILASAYLNALGEMLHMTLMPSVPDISIGTSGTMTHTFSDSGRSAEKTLLLETEFFSCDEGVKSHFFLFPAPSSLSMILSSLGSSH